MEYMQALEAEIDLNHGQVNVYSKPCYQIKLTASVDHRATKSKYNISRFVRKTFTSPATQVRPSNLDELNATFPSTSFYHIKSQGMRKREMPIFGQTQRQDFLLNMNVFVLPPLAHAIAPAGYDFCTANAVPSS